MSADDSIPTNVQTGREQSDKYHLMALTAQAIPVTKSLLETLQRLDQDAAEGEPDMEALAGALEQAEQELLKIRQTAHHLDLPNE